VLAAAVVLGLGSIWFPKLVGAAGGPEGELITQLKVAERDGLVLPVSGGRLAGHQLLYQRISVTVDAAARRATVLATLDFNGQFGATQVSSLGVEKIVFVFDAGVWKPETTLAPRLVAVVNALESRRRALEMGDRGQLSKLAGNPDGGLEAEVERWLELVDRKLRVDAWFIRLEREGGQVSEQYRLEAFGRDRPFRQAGPRKLQLETSGGEFFFPKGLM
jgi:hypothetical protein